MSKEERDYMKQIDEMILSASSKKLKKIQKLDKNSQLLGSTFYEAYCNSKSKSEKENLQLNLKPYNQKPKK